MKTKAILNPNKVGHHGLSTEDRFWSKVSISSKDNCWIWNAGKTGSKRYGVFSVATGRAIGAHVLAHKYSYFLKTGYFPKTEEYVCHKCDNGLCVNPDHLFLGTQFDNMQDMVSKGRNANVKGSNNPNAKVSEDVVTEMRRLYANGVSGIKLAKQFGVSKTQTFRILNNNSWSTS